jgi:hypothetical protein
VSARRGSPRLAFPEIDSAEELLLETIVEIAIAKAAAVTIAVSRNFL